MVGNKLQTGIAEVLEEHFHRELYYDPPEPIIDQIIAKVREVVGGAELTDEEIDKHNRYGDSIISEDDWDLRALLAAQLQAILKAIDKVGS